MAKQNNKKQHNLTEEEIAKALAAREAAGGAFEEVQEAEVVQEDPYAASAKEQEAKTGRKSLGKVKTGTTTMDGVSSDEALGWHDFPVTGLPSKGKFYPIGTSFMIRPAKTAEIRHFSTLEENDIFDVDDKLNHILQNCVKVRAEKKVLSWKDIIEEDRVFVILAIRDLTFKEPENKLMVKKRCPDCNEENQIEVSSKNFSLNQVPEDIEKYYSPSHRCYVIQTRSLGEIMMRPPTIGVMQVITKYIRQKEREQGAWDRAWIQILPYIQQEWRGFTDKAIFDGEVDFKGWDEKKYTVHYRLAEKLRIGVQQNMQVSCHACGAGVTAPVDFPEGIKSLFVISDISGELL